MARSRVKEAKSSKAAVITGTTGTFLVVGATLASFANWSHHPNANFQTEPGVQAGHEVAAAYSGCTLNNVENLQRVESGVGKVAISINATRNPSVAQAERKTFTYDPQPRIEPATGPEPRQPLRTLKWEEEEGSLDNSDKHTAIQDVALPRLLSVGGEESFNIFVDASDKDKTETVRTYCGTVVIRGSDIGIEFAQITPPSPDLDAFKILPYGQ